MEKLDVLRGSGKSWHVPGNPESHENTQGCVHARERPRSGWPWAVEAAEPAEAEL